MKNNFGKILTELLVLITLEGTKLYSSGRSYLEFLLEFDKDESKPDFSLLNTQVRKWIES